MITVLSCIAQPDHALCHYNTDLTWLFWTKRCERIAWKGALVIPKKRFRAEQIVTLLRQIEMLMAQGKSAPEACRDAGISEQSYYRWRKEYGGLELDQAKRMKDLERENARVHANLRSSESCRIESPCRLLYY